MFKLLQEDVLGNKKPGEPLLTQWQMFKDSAGREHTVDYPGDPDRETAEIKRLREEDNQFLLANPDLVAKLRMPASVSAAPIEIPFDKVAREYLAKHGSRGGTKAVKASTIERTRGFLLIYGSPTSSRRRFGALAP